MRTGRITAGHARAVLSLPEEAERLGLLEEILRKGLSVRQAEAVAKSPKRPKSALTRRARDPNLDALETRLARHLGTRVMIHSGRKKGAGRISIEYRSLDDLDRILEAMEGP